MEGVQSAFRKMSKDVKSLGSSALEAQSISSQPPPLSSSYVPHEILATRPPRNLVSIGTCSKLCAAFFVAGVFVGYTLKRRVRRWLSSIARRLKDD